MGRGEGSGANATAPGSCAAYSLSMGILTRGTRKRQAVPGGNLWDSVLSWPSALLSKCGRSREEPQSRFPEDFGNSVSLSTGSLERILDQCT